MKNSHTVNEPTDEDASLVATQNPTGSFSGFKADLLD